MFKTVTAVAPSALRQPLPPLPSGFERELASVGSMNGHPMFKIVDGQRAMKWRNGKMDIKHLLQSEDYPCYVPVVTEVFRRKVTGTDGYIKFPSYTAAKETPITGLDTLIEGTKFSSVRAVGRACWIVEVYVTPEEVNERAWNETRYARLTVKGVPQEVDVLGPFPSDGMYVYCFSVLGDDGSAIAPGPRTITECKQRWQTIQKDTVTVEDGAHMLEDKLEEFERKQVERVGDSFYQFHGVAARRLHHGVVSKPITNVYGQPITSKQ